MLASMQRNGLRLALFAVATTALVSGVQSNGSPPSPSLSSSRFS